MPAVYFSLHYHLVFSTQDCYPSIQPQWKPRLYRCMTSNVKQQGGIVQAIGGTLDHVHLFIGLQATHCLADVVKQLKKFSTTWMHETMKLGTFAWQEQFAAFTVSASARDGVKRYIAHQEHLHRRKKSYAEELVEMFKKAGLPYHPRFLE